MSDAIQRIPDYDSEDFKRVFALTLRNYTNRDQKLRRAICQVVNISNGTLDQWMSGASEVQPSAYRMCLILSFLGAWAYFLALLHDSESELEVLGSQINAGLDGMMTTLGNGPPSAELDAGLSEIHLAVEKAGRVCQEILKSRQLRDRLVPRDVASEEDEDNVRSVPRRVG